MKGKNRREVGVMEADISSKNACCGSGEDWPPLFRVPGRREIAASIQAVADLVAARLPTIKGKSKPAGR